MGGRQKLEVSVAAGGAGRLERKAARLSRRGFLRQGAQVTAWLVTVPTWAAEQNRTRSGEEQLLGEAKARIARHRQGDGRIVVYDGKGNPVPGVKVTVEQLSHDFLFGCNCFQFGRCGDPDREAAYRSRFAALFNYCTLGFYWGAYEPEQGKPNYDYTDRVVEWARAQGIACKGHPLVWDHPASSPRWLPEDGAQIAELSNARVRAIVSRYRDRIEFWDVVNEATHLPQGVNRTKMARWGAALGPAAYVAGPLGIAREANPKARLVVNDYRTDRSYYQLLERVRAQGESLFDIVGIQSHMHDGAWPLSKVWEVCETYQRLGLPLHFTETTLLSGPRKGPGENWGPTSAEGEANQADETAGFYTTLFSHPAVEAITWWDFSDYHAWQRAPAGWVRADMSPKPVYERLQQLIKGAWWTKAEGHTDARGTFGTHAYFGTHRITVEARQGKAVNGSWSQEVRWERQRPNRYEFHVA